MGKPFVPTVAGLMTEAGNSAENEKDVYYETLTGIGSDMHMGAMVSLCASES